MDPTQIMELAAARPYSFKFKPESTALLLIDMQRDFLDADGFGAVQCGDDEKFRKVRDIVPTTRAVLDASRDLGLHIIHTREGHKPDLSDLPASKRLRQISSPSGHHNLGIGDRGPMGRLLVQGEYGHDIIDELKPLPGEVIIDKPGKGSFWNTPLHRQLLARGITHLLVTGVTTDCCVNTTFRELADRGFECCLLDDCTSGFEPAVTTSTINMLCHADGLFGFVGRSTELLKQIEGRVPTPPVTPPGPHGDMSLSRLREQYHARQIRPADVANEVLRRIKDHQEEAVWTYILNPESLMEAAAKLEQRFQDQPLPPLYGIPFAVKDNIDVAGIKTTAACDQFAYTPESNAPVVEAMLNAGALFVGKTNLDQLATGLSGCRSPYGTPRSVFGKDRIPGGSSSGSAVAVGAGLVTFALATDTAGSGRVPAAFNSAVGFKPTKGTFSAQGLVPACKSLDTITIMARTVDEARKIWLVGNEGPDVLDPYAKPQQSLALWHAEFRGYKAAGFTFGIPPQAALSACTPEFAKMFAGAVERMKRAGGTPQEVDWAPFRGGSDLLYGASLVQERLASIGPEFIAKYLDKFQPAVQEIFRKALESDVKPWEVFRDQHLQAEYTRQAALIFRSIDVLLVPTTPCHPTVDEMAADPVRLNAKVGEFTHFGNVLDLCGIAVPACTYKSDRDEELPFGVSLIGATGMDGKLFDIAREFQRTE